MKSSDSLLGSYCFNDSKHCDPDPFRSVCRLYDHGAQQSICSMRFKSSPSDTPTVPCELKKGSAWKVNIVYGKIGGFQCSAKTLPLASGNFRCLDHYFTLHLLNSLIPRDQTMAA
jgi:hypothetical protein